jgi:hypothetical protein
MMKTSIANILLPSGIHPPPCISGILRHGSFIPRGIGRVSSVWLIRWVNIAHRSPRRLSEYLKEPLLMLGQAPGADENVG